MDFAQIFRARQRRRLRGTSRLPAPISLSKRLMMLAAVLLVTGTLFVTGLFAWYSFSLPSPEKIVRKEGFSTQILSRSGEVLYDVYSNVQREPVKFEDVPAHLRNATIAIEDKNFYQHEGFDPWGMARAMFNTLVRGKLQGGSTLTQQLVKNMLLTSQRSLPRKIKEFVLAVQIEKRFTKDQILQMYLQESPYGGASVGVEVASRTYFGKPVRELTLVESAFLAGMPQAPSRYSPYGSNPSAYQGRTEQVLRRMREDGYISQDEEKQALADLDSIKFLPAGGSITAPHFVMYVKELLVEQFGEERVENGGLKVTTTLDLDFHNKVQAIVTEEVEKVTGLDISNGAAVAMNPLTGEILSMVGSRDYFSKEIDGQVNVVSRKRQPGSAIKPVTYAAAFRKGFSPASMLVDAKISFDSGDPTKPYEPENYDGKFRGPVQLRYALGSSLNLPSVELLQLVGLKDMLSLAYQMGFTTLEPTAANMSRLGLSVTLGGGEVKLIDMVTAYSSFANGGVKVEPTAILKVEDARGNKLYEFHQAKGKQVLSAAEAYLMTNILSDNSARLLTFGENSLLNMGNRPVAVKTGTTNDRRDNWAVGWSRTAIVGAWVGNNDNSPMKQVASGVSGASPIWRRAMMEALATYPSQAFDMPAGVLNEQVDVISGYKSHDGWPSRLDYFLSGTVLEGPDPIHTKLWVCKNDGKLASPVEVAKGDAEEREFIVLKAPQTLPEADRTRWQTGIDAWINLQADGKYKPPTESCGQSEDAVIRVKQPTDQTRISDNDIDWEVEVVSNQRVEKVEIFVDGQTRQTLDRSPWRSTINLSNGTYRLRFKARLEGGKEVESGEIRIGVNRDWDSAPTPTISPTPTPKP